MVDLFMNSHDLLVYRAYSPITPPLMLMPEARHAFAFVYYHISAAERLLRAKLKLCGRELAYYRCVLNAKKPSPRTARALAMTLFLVFEVGIDLVLDFSDDFVQPASLLLLDVIGNLLFDVLRFTELDRLSN